MPLRGPDSLLIITQFFSMDLQEVFGEKTTTGHGQSSDTSTGRHTKKIIKLKLSVPLLLPLALAVARIQPYTIKLLNPSHCHCRGLRCSWWLVLLLHGSPLSTLCTRV